MFNSMEDGDLEVSFIDRLKTIFWAVVLGIVIISFWSMIAYQVYKVFA